MSKSSGETTDHPLLHSDVARELGSLMVDLSEVYGLNLKQLFICQHVGRDNLEDLVVMKFGK